MKKQTMIGALALTVGILAASQVVQAEDTYTEKTRNANVEITGGTDEIIPTPPEPYPPTGPYVPVKELGITSATNLYFDPISLSSETTTRDALYVANDGTPISNVAGAGGVLPTVPVNGDAYVPGFSVTDRRGTGAGWSLTLQLGEFLQTDAAQGATVRKLKGATLTFPQVEPVTVATASPAANEYPTTFGKTFESGGAARVIMNAEEGQGKGLWEARYNSRELALSDGSTAVKAPIVLSVPGDNYVGTYQADMVWNLSDAPAANPAD